jgi:hypothetical protein
LPGKWNREEICAEQRKRWHKRHLFDAGGYAGGDRTVKALESGRALLP